MVQLPNPDEMRARFHELGAQREAIAAQVKPLREQYDALAAQAGEIHDKQKALAAQFKPMEQPLVAIDQERAALARALGGKTGPAPGQE